MLHFSALWTWKFCTSFPLLHLEYFLILHTLSVRIIFPYCHCLFFSYTLVLLQKHPGKKKKGAHSVAFNILNLVTDICLTIVYAFDLHISTVTHGGIISNLEMENWDADWITGLAYSHIGSLWLTLHAKWRLPKFQTIFCILLLHVSVRPELHVLLIDRKFRISEKKPASIFPLRLLMDLNCSRFCWYGWFWSTALFFVYEYREDSRLGEKIGELVRESHQYKLWYSCLIFK